LTNALESEARTKTAPHGAFAGAALKNGRVWAFSVIYFGLVYSLYALAFFLPTIISGFETQFGAKFDVLQKSFITAVPYLPAAVALYFWSKDATNRGVQWWHVGVPAVIGALSIPIALFMSSPAATVATITVTACAIFSALPIFGRSRHGS